MSLFASSVRRVASTKIALGLLLLGDVRHHRDRATARHAAARECDTTGRRACGPRSSCPKGCAGSPRASRPAHRRRLRRSSRFRRGSAANRDRAGRAAAAPAGRCTSPLKRLLQTTNLQIAIRVDERARHVVERDVELRFLVRQILFGQLLLGDIRHHRDGAASGHPAAQNAIPPAVRRVILEAQRPKGCAGSRRALATSASTSPSP